MLLAETIDTIYAFRPVKERNAWSRTRRLSRTTLTIQGVSVTVYTDDGLRYWLWRELDDEITSGRLTLTDPPCKQLTFAAQNTPWEMG